MSITIAVIITVFIIFKSLMFSLMGYMYIRFFLLVVFPMQLSVLRSALLFGTPISLRVPLNSSGLSMLMNYGSAASRYFLLSYVCNLTQAQQLAEALRLLRWNSSTCRIMWDQAVRTWSGALGGEENSFKIL